MTKRYSAIEVKMERGELKLRGIGRTMRGQAYIKETVGIGTKRIRDHDFKSKMSDAVSKLFESEA